MWGRASQVLLHALPSDSLIPFQIIKVSNPMEFDTLYFFMTYSDYLASWVLNSSHGLK